MAYKNNKHTMFSSLTGYRTYILGAIGILTVVASWLGFISTEAASGILMVVVPGGMMTLRAAVK